MAWPILYKIKWNHPTCQVSWCTQLSLYQNADICKENYNWLDRPAEPGYALHLQTM